MGDINDIKLHTAALKLLTEKLEHQFGLKFGEPLPCGRYEVELPALSLNGTLLFYIYVRIDDDRCTPAGYSAVLPGKSTLVFSMGVKL